MKKKLSVKQQVQIEDQQNCQTQASPGKDVKGLINGVAVVHSKPSREGLENLSWDELVELFKKKYDLTNSKKTNELCERLNKKRIMLLLEEKVATISVCFMLSFKELNNNKKCALLMCSFYPDNFKFLSNELKGDKDVIELVLKKDGKMLEHVEGPLKESVEIIDLAIESDGYAIRFCPEKFRTKERALRAMKTDPINFAWCQSSEIRGDLDILELAFKGAASRAMLYISTPMRSEIEKHQKCFNKNLKETALWYIGTKRSEIEKKNISDSLIESDDIAGENSVVVLEGEKFGENKKRKFL